MKYVIEGFQRFANKALHKRNEKERNIDSVYII